MTGGSLVLKIMPINARSFRLGIGGGIGIAELRQITEERDYNTYEGQALGVIETTFFPGKLRLKVRGIYRRGRWGMDEAPVLEEKPNTGDGLFYTVGFSLEF